MGGYLFGTLLLFVVGGVTLRGVTDAVGLSGNQLNTTNFIHIVTYILYMHSL